MAIRPNMANPSWYIIVDNASQDIFVWGDLTSTVPMGSQYMIVNLEPPDRSAVVDSADSCSGQADPNSADNGVGPPWVDMGALERQCCSTSFPSDMLGQCCGNAYTHGTSQYYICPGQVPWATAAFRCAQYDAHLVAIGDSAENSFVGSLITNIWLGANDIWEEGSFWWVTNEPWTYEIWDTDQPDNINNEDCLEMITTSRWQDTSCEYNRAFVCEKPN
jgi:hypothetical protein